MISPKRGMVGLLLLPTLACASVRGPINTEPRRSSCSVMVRTPSREPLPIDSVLSDPLLDSRYSAGSLAIANAYGLVDDIRGLENLRGGGAGPVEDDEVRLQIVIAERGINEALDIASLELQSLVDFIDCEGSRLSKIRTELLQQNSKQDGRLTRAAIITGAVSVALVAGIVLSGDDALKGGDAMNWIGIAGGVAATAFAVRSGQVNRTVIVEHDNNAVRAMWNGDNARGFFPPAPWYLLDLENIFDVSGSTLRNTIMAEWTTSQSMLGDEDRMAELPVFLDSSGTYDESMLLVRIYMLDEIGSGLEWLKYALLRFRVQVVR